MVARHLQIVLLAGTLSLLAPSTWAHHNPTMDEECILLNADFIYRCGDEWHYHHPGTTLHFCQMLTELMPLQLRESSKANSSHAKNYWLTAHTNAQTIFRHYCGNWDGTKSIAKDQKDQENKPTRKSAQQGTNRPSSDSAQAEDWKWKTWNTWHLCTWDEKYPHHSFSKPFKIQCIENNRFRPNGSLAVGTDLCREVLGAVGARASFSEHTNYSSGRRFLGNGRELCAAECQADAAKGANVTCDPEMITP